MNDIPFEGFTYRVVPRRLEESMDPQSLPSSKARSRSASFFNWMRKFLAALGAVGAVYVAVRQLERDTQQDVAHAQLSLREIVESIESGEFDTAADQIANLQAYYPEDERLDVLDLVLHAARSPHSAIPLVKIVAAENFPRKEALLGAVALNQDDLHAARMLLDQAIVREPSDELARYLRGVVLLRGGHFKEAQAEFFQSRSLLSTDPRPWVGAAIAARELGDFVHAVEYLEQARALADGHVPHLQMASCLVHARGPEAAYAVLLTTRRCRECREDGEYHRIQMLVRQQNGSSANAVERARRRWNRWQTRTQELVLSYLAPARKDLLELANGSVFHTTAAPTTTLAQEATRGSPGTYLASLQRNSSR